MGRVKFYNEFEWSDKMSSVLDITYKRSQKRSVALLCWDYWNKACLRTAKTDKFTYLLGFHSRSNSLLSSQSRKLPSNPLPMCKVWLPTSQILGGWFRGAPGNNFQSKFTLWKEVNILNRVLTAFTANIAIDIAFEDQEKTGTRQYAGLSATATAKNLRLKGTLVRKWRGRKYWCTAYLFGERDFDKKVKGVLQLINESARRRRLSNLCPKPT